MFGCYRATLTSPCVLYSGELIVRVMLQACWLSLAGEVYACRLDIIIRFLEIGYLAVHDFAELMLHSLASDYEWHCQISPE